MYRTKAPKVTNGVDGCTYRVIQHYLCDRHRARLPWSIESVDMFVREPFTEIVEIVASVSCAGFLGCEGVDHM
jgi:hypothetical protein